MKAIVADEIRVAGAWPVWRLVIKNETTQKLPEINCPPVTAISNVVAGDAGP